MKLLQACLVASLLLLSGCATSVSDASVCPRPITYSDSFLNRAADELDALPEGSAIAQMIEDYGRERSMLRACRDLT